MPVRGYQSSVSSRMHAGLDGQTKIDSIVVVWPTGKKSKIANINGRPVARVGRSKLDPN
nr:ASPIC/UnbV domain-containing protein [Haliscomenobacter sp.]